LHGHDLLQAKVKHLPHTWSHCAAAHFAAELPEAGAITGYTRERKDFVRSIQSGRMQGGFRPHEGGAIEPIRIAEVASAGQTAVPRYDRQC
jgi:hypothetical protein